jgi:hypothetical protein
MNYPYPRFHGLHNRLIIHGISNAKKYLPTTRRDDPLERLYNYYYCHWASQLTIATGNSRRFLVWGSIATCLVVTVAATSPSSKIR